MPARHDRLDLEAFQGGERCLVWARTRPGGNLVYLEDGDAEKMRSWTKGHLECLMPNCNDRRLTTVSRHPRRRDGFSHYSGAGGHSAEGEAHQQGKATLIAWVTRTLGHEGVTAVAEQAIAQRERIADVMVTWPGGRQVALEVQYATLTVKEWRLRHESYTRRGIVDVWLFGHLGRHLKRAPEQISRGPGAIDDVIVLSDLHSAMVEAQVPLFWFNPVLASGASIGTVSAITAPHDDGYGPFDDGHDLVKFEVPPEPDDRYGVFHVDPLEVCILSPAGLATPTSERLRVSAVDLALVNSKRSDAFPGRHAAAADARSELLAQERIGRDKQRRRVETEQWRRRVAWDRSVLKQGLLLWHNNTVPAIFTKSLGTEQGVLAPQEHWRVAVYRHLIWGRVGQGFDVSEALACIRAEGISAKGNRRDLLAVAVTSWLGYLESCGYVSLSRASHVASSVVVLADLRHPPDLAGVEVKSLALREPANESQRSAGAAPAIDRYSRRSRTPSSGGSVDAAAGALSAIDAPKQPPVGAKKLPSPTRVVYCSTCRLRLDPMLNEFGRHAYQC